MKKGLLEKIINSKEIHCRWLNTLSMMENEGAKKIKKCEHPIFVTEMMLKHAAEETKHAYYLKKQIKKINGNACPTYEKKFLLVPNHSYFYLDMLDILVCRYLKKEFELKMEKLKYGAYLLVTYAIEVRADELYPIYQKELDHFDCKVSVRNIIFEEENHLKEMKIQLKDFNPNWEKMCQKVCELETNIYNKWMGSLEEEIVLSTT